MEKKNINIKIQELVSRDVYGKFGIESIQLIDKRIIDVSEWLSAYFELPLLMNNWHEGGRREHSGFRGPDCKIGATFSQHRFGRAMDFNITGYQPEVIRNVVRKEFRTLRKLGLTTIEWDTPSWVHIDCRNTGKNYLMEVSYKR